MNSRTAANVSTSESGATPVFVAVALELAAHEVVGLERLHRREDPLLAVAQLLDPGSDGRLHREQADGLEQVVLDDVAQRADLLVELAPALHAEVLRHRDLHLAHVVAVPDRLEERVGEPEVEDVLDRLLAEVVVDPEDVLLGEDRVEHLVELLAPTRGRARTASR